jgi:hypothetical protein
VYILHEVIDILIPHFDKYPLITQKQKNYNIWKNIVKLINKGDHLNNKGLIKIIILKLHILYNLNLIIYNSK